MAPQSPKAWGSLVPAPGESIAWAALLALIPDLEPLKVTPQDPIHHAEGDVWTHTMMVCEALLKLHAYREGDPDLRFVLFYACLLHDLAKPSCTQILDTGRITSAGHSKRGAIDARVVMWRAGIPFALREQICRIIAQHQLPFYAIQGSKGRTAEFLANSLSWDCTIDALCVVAEADLRGRHCSDSVQILDNIELFREMAREQGCYHQPREFPDAHTRLSYFRSEGAISPDYAFFQEPGSAVTVLSGLPASGKNTWVSREMPNLAVISFDDAREELGLKHGVSAGAAVHLAIDRAKALLRAKKPFVWNATHLSDLMLSKTLDLLYRYNAQVEIVYLESPEAVIKARNAARDTTLSNQAIDKMLCRWDVPLPSLAHVVRYEVS